MEGEEVADLHAAVMEYRSQLAAVEELLAADPDNIEAKEARELLQGGLRDTTALLEQLGAAAAFDGEDAAAATTATAATGTTEAAGEAAAVAPVVPTRPRGGAAGNARMHPSNRYYRSEPDFGALAAQYEELRPYVTTNAAGRSHLDTTSWEATRALTSCLLRSDFGVRWWLPEGQLVPPVTNRANYLHWIHDLLDLSSPEAASSSSGGDADAPSPPPARGLDIGCGANLIYCLLGAALYGWSMVGVDVTEVAASACRQLIQDNPQLAPLLEVRDLSKLHPELQRPDASAPAGLLKRGRKRPARGQDPEAGEQEKEQGQEQVAGGRSGDQREGAAQEAGEGTTSQEEEGAAGNARAGILLPAFVNGDETFSFTMCNPPFFENMKEAAQNPNTAFGGTAAEMVCPGGELAFVLQMLVESEALQDRVHWFSTMVGKKNTLKALRKELHSRHVTALRTTELAQGKTSRWAVAWSWQVHPNKASQPLRRLEDNQDQQFEQQQQQQQRPDSGSAGEPQGGAAGASRAARQQAVAAAAAGPSLAAGGMRVLPRRHVSFTVQKAGTLDGRALLQRVQSLLAERGCGPVILDPAAWAVSWPLQVGALSGDSSGVSKSIGAAPGGSDGGGGSSSNITARLRVAQQQRGRVEVVATIPNTAPDAAARSFAGLMATLEQALGR